MFKFKSFNINIKIVIKSRFLYDHNNFDLTTIREQLIFNERFITCNFEKEAEETG